MRDVNHSGINSNKQRVFKVPFLCTLVKSVLWLLGFNGRPRRSSTKTYHYYFNTRMRAREVIVTLLLGIRC